MTFVLLVLAPAVLQIVPLARRQVTVGGMNVYKGALLNNTLMMDALVLTVNTLVLTLFPEKIAMMHVRHVMVQAKTTAPNVIPAIYKMEDALIVAMKTIF